MTGNAIAGVVAHFVMLRIHLCLRVACGASPHRRIVARMAFAAHAVGIAVIQREGVIKGGIAPVVGIVALAALPRKVIGRTIAGMAGHTIRLSGVIERDIPPIAGVVT